jgi:hypothetical protein
MKLLGTSVLLAGVTVVFSLSVVRAQGTAPTKAPPAAAAAPAATCKAFGGGKCCDPAVVAHLPKQAVMSACAESETTYLGEKGDKDTCKLFFKVPGEKDEETFVQIYAPAQKDVPEYPTDPFFSWKKMGKVFMTDKAKSPKSAPMLLVATGLWFPGKGYFVSVNASIKVCTKVEVTKLAKSMK